MLIVMTDPDSVLAWLRVDPRRHAAQVRALATRHPEWAPAITEALRRMRVLQAAAKGAAHGQAGS